MTEDQKQKLFAIARKRCTDPSDLKEMIDCVLALCVPSDESAIDAELATDKAAEMAEQEKVLKEELEKVEAWKKNRR